MSDLLAILWFADDVSLLVLLLDTNPLFWSTTPITFSQFLSHVLAFLNAILGLNQLNQVVVIATGYSSCDYIYDSSFFRYVAVMNSIFSAQRLMVPIDSCYVGTKNSAFLQQASYITGGVHHKPEQLDGLFQYLTTIFATDLHSRGFIQLPKPVGVDFRASCFCHKKTIDMGYICSVCLSIFCEHHKRCSTCGSVFGQSKLDDASSL